ncbi:MAG TPA: hypothetical protein H9800_02820 [Candidatus Microbacterium stercoravium]|uniref:Uncharacterized protein n=1 Tax=Candidatus Microbacterium stercoravium TaxID=2838697 RepID=A0A9D2H4H8_9MICO|nr:hypothetical protein [Candidatus Microbacterium stercoravium]
MASQAQVPAPALVAFASVGYLALLVAGLGFGSLIIDDDVITTSGVGLISAYVAAGISILAFAGFLIGPARHARPSFWLAGSTALGTAATHALALGVAALVSTGDLGVVGGVLSEILVGWVSPLIFGAALIASWAAIALRRTVASRPRWPWEDE